jgi:hypothetical protein
MSATIPDLWSDRISQSALAPRAILAAQAERLSQKTGGLVEGELYEDRNDNNIILRLDLFAPAIGYRETLLKARHREDRVYPVTITAVGLGPKAPPPIGVEGEADLPERTATSQDAFLDLVRQVLTSEETVASMGSAVARSNEVHPPALEVRPEQETETAQELEEQRLALMEKMRKDVAAFVAIVKGGPPPSPKPTR